MAIKLHWQNPNEKEKMMCEKSAPKTYKHYRLMAHSIEDVTCKKCLKQLGKDQDNG